MANLGEMVVKIVGDTTGFTKSVDESGKKMVAFGINAVAMIAAAKEIGKAIYDTVKDLVEYGATIQTANERTGVSIKKLQEYKYVAEQTGGSLDTITSSIKLMTRGLDTNKAVFEQLGIQTKNASGQFRSASDIFDDTIAKLGALSNDTERTNLALKLFGRGAVDLVPLLKEGAQGISDLKQKAHDLGLVLSDETIIQAHDLEKATDSLKASWKAFTMSLVADSIPVIKNLSNTLIDTVSILNSWKTAQKNVDIINAYVKGRDSVIQYHDALVALIAYNQKVIDSDTALKKNKDIAAAEISKDYHLLDQAARDYGAAIGAQDAIQAKLAKDEADREAKRIADAEAAARAAADEANNFAISQQIAENALINRSEAMNAHALKVQAEKDAVAKLTAQYIEFGNAMAGLGNDPGSIMNDVKAKATQKNLSDIHTQIVELSDAAKLLRDNVSGGLVSAFEAFGESMVQEGNWVKAFFKSLINSVGEAVIAFAGLVEAQGWATFPIVDWLKVGEGIALAVTGGVIKASATALADGGVVMPQPGGTRALIAEAGQAEAVIPLDKLDRMLATQGGASGTDSMTHLVVNLDSRPLLDKIFDATKNRTVLISQGAVV
jgi:hypothetical protein